MNRRTLIIRLSALAVAPLAKWLPAPVDPEPRGITREQIDDVASLYFSTIKATRVHSINDRPRYWELLPAEPIPQEEA